MIVLFTDFGLAGPYVGQMLAVLHQHAPLVPVINLFADAPRFAPRPAAYLLAAYAPTFPPGTVFLCVVDPGVGTADRLPMILEADGRLYVGPGNGLLEVVAQRAQAASWCEITWRPQQLSASFHGRDLFAPVAGQLACGRWPECVRAPGVSAGGWPDDLAEIIYIDSFGNGMTGLRATAVAETATLKIGSHLIQQARTFGAVPRGAVFWYANANGLVEIAVNQGRADAILGLEIGTPVSVLP